jgi:isoquinoline 1-oxidoreductase beta subunit
MSDSILNVSRRGFLQGIISSGALILSVRMVPEFLWAAEASGGTHADLATLHPNLFVGIDTDGTVHLVAARSEMGTTSRTSVPLILADELDADWKRVKLEQAIGYKRYGDQDTDGSHSVRDGFGIMREAGATARLMLTQAAAQKWGVPVSECESDLHVIVHRPTKRKAGYGELAAAAAKLPVPKKEDLRFKPSSAWRYIGKGATSYDLADICTGKAGFGMDAHLEGMVFASVEHPPVLGGKVKSYDEKAPLQVKGVKQTIPIKPFTPPHHFQPLGGVAVCRQHLGRVSRTKEAQRVLGQRGGTLATTRINIRRVAGDSPQAGEGARNIGDVDAVFAKAGKIMEAEYYLPHLAHATMEPPVALADFRDGKVTIWAPTQSPQAVQETVAAELGIPPESVICHVSLLGGGFGRKSKPDYAAEAAILSKAVGKPVKVVWSREDDIKFGYYHAVSAMYMKAALDEKGMPTAWLQRSVFPPIGSTFALNTTYGDGGDLGQGWIDLPFDIPIIAPKTGRRKTMSASDGFDLWQIFTTPSRPSRSPTNSRMLPDGIRSNTCWS